jgi:dTMP kinase
MEREKSHLRSVWADIREGLDFIFVNPVVRAVNIGLATGLVGGAMLIPLGPTFARFVIGDADTFPLFITAMGVGVASGVVLVSAIQNRLPKETVFPFCVMGAGMSLFLGVSMSSFWLAALGVAGLGLFAGATYVLGFTLLQSHTDADLRGRIFTTLLTLVRLCVMLALLMGPVLATIFNGFARAATGDPEPEVPTWSFFGFDLAIPGVRITLWLASAIIFGAGVLAARSMKLGIRSSLKSGWADVTGELRFRNSGGEVALEEAGDEPPGEEAS